MLSDDKKSFLFFDTWNEVKIQDVNLRRSRFARGRFPDLTSVKFTIRIGNEYAKAEATESSCPFVVCGDDVGGNGLVIEYSLGETFELLSKDIIPSTAMCVSRASAAERRKLAVSCVDDWERMVEAATAGSEPRKGSERAPENGRLTNPNASFCEVMCVTVFPASGCVVAATEVGSLVCGGWKTECLRETSGTSRGIG